MLVAKEGCRPDLGSKELWAAVVGSLGEQPPEELWAVLQLTPFTAPDGRRLVVCVR